MMQSQMATNYRFQKMSPPEKRDDIVDDGGIGEDAVGVVGRSGVAQRRNRVTKRQPN